MEKTLFHLQQNTSMRYLEAKEVSAVLKDKNLRANYQCTKSETKKV